MFRFLFFAFFTAISQAAFADVTQGNSGCKDDLFELQKYIGKNINKVLKRNPYLLNNTFGPLKIGNELHSYHYSTDAGSGVAGTYTSQLITDAQTGKILYATCTIFVENFK